MMVSNMRTVCAGFLLLVALRRGISIQEVNQLTGIDLWFLDNLLKLTEFEEELKSFNSLDQIGKQSLLKAKQYGFSDKYLAELLNSSEANVREKRYKHGLLPVYKRVDTCGAEFEAFTPYLYSTYEEECEANPIEKKKIMILGGGPNRIGQGIEFDYCCVHASFALKEDGFETIMVNCNPETVSTDYDTSDRLYFEPVTLEDVLHIIKTEKPTGIIVQLG